MQNKFIVTVDSSCDGSLTKLKEQNVPIIFFPYSDEKQSYIDNMLPEDNVKFFDNMKKGVVYRTSQINDFAYEEFFRKVYDEFHLPIIHVSLCEALSKSIVNARNVADKLKKEGILVTPVDSLIASSGVYLLVEKAVEKRDAGEDYELAAKELQDFVYHTHTWYIVNDLTYFARGGRLPKIAAAFAKSLNINVILRCSRMGNLEVVYKLFGRRQAWKKIISLVQETGEDMENQTLYVANAQNEDGAKELSSQIQEVCHFKNVEINPMGKIIGAHAGPGIIAVFYSGTEVTDPFQK